MYEELRILGFKNHFFRENAMLNSETQEIMEKLENILPGALWRAVFSYELYSTHQPDSRDFKTHHLDCRAALAHVAALIGLMLKMEKLNNGETGNLTLEEEKTRQLLLEAGADVQRDFEG